MEDREEFKRMLMATFQSELEEHLATLTKGFLTLEKGSDLEERESLLAELFRAAHSLKGAARSVGLRDIEIISHGLEDVLAAIQRGELSPSSEVLDWLFPVLDALPQTMAANQHGESLSSDHRERLLAGMEAIAKGEAPPPHPPDAPQSENPGPSDMNPSSDSATAHEQDRGNSTSDPGPSQSEPSLPAIACSNPSSSQSAIEPAPMMETIRVAVDKLDALMDSSGELLTANMRAEQRLAELRGLRVRLGRWQAAWRRTRSDYSRMRGNASRDNGASPAMATETVRALDFLAHHEQQLNSFAEEIDVLLEVSASDQRRLKLVSDELHEEVRRTRMIPVAMLFETFTRMVRDLAREQRKEVDLRIEGASTEVDRKVLELMKDPLTHLLRNAVDHGIEAPDVRQSAGKPRQGTVWLRAAHQGGNVVFEIADDGAGIDLEAVRRVAEERGFLKDRGSEDLDSHETTQLIFQSGLSTLPQATDLSGRGIGLDVVRQNLERMQGLIHVDSIPGDGTTLTLRLPLTLAVSQALLVEVAGETLAVRDTAIERVLRVAVADIGRLDGKPAIRANGKPLPLLSLAQVLELGASDIPVSPDHKVPVVILGVAEKRVAFSVDEFRGIQDMVVKGLGRQLRRVRNVAGATILGTGQVVMILNVADLMKSALQMQDVTVRLPVEVQEAMSRRVLVVDDSITTRTLERNVLEKAGYQVLVAADGQEAWGLLQSEQLDAIVTDIDMPILDGFGLTDRVKRDDRLKHLPVVLMTSLESAENKGRGLEVGADAYITKSSFDQRELLETIERLIG